MIDFIVLHEKEGGKAIRQSIDNIDSYCDEGEGARVCLKCVDYTGGLAEFWVKETADQIDQLISKAQGSFFPVMADKWNVDIVAELISALKINKDGIRDAIREAVK